MLENKKFYIQTQGCQMNEYDSDKLGDVLKYNLKMTRTSTPNDADLLFLNTCSIREKAQEKVFHQLGRWKKIKNDRPDILIAVGGCVATQEGDNIKTRSPEVDIIFGPQTIHRLPKMIKDLYKNKSKVEIDISFPEIEKFDFLPSSQKKTPSAYLSIMEGCSKYCTFCVVPYTRGEEVNRRFDDVLYEAFNLSKLGTREIVLLGQNVNAYQSYNHNQEKVSFSDLIRHISYIDGISRIRHTTSHPIDFSEDLIREYMNPKLANNLHLPVQSGSDTILARMKRKHTVLEYKSIIKKIRKYRPDIHLTSDFIIGYPGETDYEFTQTMEFIAELNFSDAYSFIYSPRPGTPAASEKDDVSFEIKKRRLNELQALIKEQSLKFSSKMLGTMQKVLVEGISVKKTNEVTGRSFNNKVINFPADKSLIGTFVEVLVTEVKGNTLYGEISTNQFHKKLDEKRVTVAN
tara:strand:- start:32633 stop:34012 length:1380 start_codon:yes stop_codon:yes gene_type:complete